MSRCVPGMPCYGGNVKVYYTYPFCSTSQRCPTTLAISSNNLYYTGPNLPYTGIQTDDSLTVALQKIDVQLNPEEIFDLFITAIDNNPSLMSIFCSRIAACP